MNFKCVFRDPMGWVKVLSLTADSLEDALVGLHDKCRAEVRCADSVDRSQLMVWLEYIFDADNNHYRIQYQPADLDPVSPAEIEEITGEQVIFIKEPAFLRASTMELGE